MEDYLMTKVFCSAASTCLQPDPAGVDGFQAYMERYIASIPAQQAAEKLQ
jgi:hypothetical protein